LDLKDLRKQIDEIDSSLVELYEKRMEVSSAIADYKIENGKKVFSLALNKSIDKPFPDVISCEHKKLPSAARNEKGVYTICLTVFLLPTLLFASTALNSETVSSQCWQPVSKQRT